jgi:hypothetical protein
LTVGTNRVVVVEAGDYDFLLEKGIEYTFGTEPVNTNVIYTAVDDVPREDENGLMMVANEAGAASGTWTVDGGWLRLIEPTLSHAGWVFWMPRFTASPDVQHLGPGEGDTTFYAMLSDYAYAQNVSHHWESENADFVIVSPESEETQIRFLSMPSWKKARLSVTASFGTNSLESVLGFSYGTNEHPQVGCSLSIPSVVLLSTNRTDRTKYRAMNVSFVSDVETNGMVSLECVRGGEHIALWRTRDGIGDLAGGVTWDAASFTGLTAYVEGIRTSEELGDVEVRVKYTPLEGEAIVRSGMLTVAEVRDVVLPGAEEDGLVVQTGTSVAMEVECLPVGVGDELSSVWSVRRLRANGQYDDWEYATGNYGGVDVFYRPATGGIYQVQATVTVGSSDGGAAESFYRWSESEEPTIGYHKKGDLKAFGVVDELWQKQLRDAAKAYLGSTAYLEYAYLPAQYGFPAFAGKYGAYKCNIFVAHRAVEVGLTVPKINGRILKRNPPLANQWGDPSFDIENWRILSESEYPQPGFIVSEPKYDGNPGHLGIVDFDARGISAGRDNVNRYFDLDGGCYYRQYNLEQEDQ